MIAPAKTTYPVLDAIRGIAALLVVVRHTPQLWRFQIDRTYLAVDIFFLLSGFVIAHAYEAKLATGRMSVARFIGVRLIRFYPMYLLAMAVGGVAILTGAQVVAGVDRVTPADLTRWVASEVIFLPTHQPPEQSNYHVIGVAWTLAWELLVNIVYAWTRPLLTTKVLAWATAACACALAAVAVHFNGLNAGFHWSALHFATGGLRAFFGVFFGVLLFRERHRLWRLLPSAHPTALSLSLLGLVLAIPALPRGNAWVDMACVALLVPLTVLIAARPPPPHRRAASGPNGCFPGSGRSAFPSIFSTRPALRSPCGLHPSSCWTALH